MACHLCICFPASTVVTTKNGKKRMDQLESLDELLTFDSKTKRGKWTTFYSFAHVERNVTAKFVALKVSNGKTLTMSRDHLLFLYNPNTGERFHKRASKVVEGDQLFHLGDRGEIETTPVISISEVVEKGIYSPLTYAGSFLANGFLASCYANVDNHHTAHAAFGPLRTWHKALGKMLHKKRGDSVRSSQGINGYALKLINLRDHLPSKVINYLGAKPF